MTAAAKTAGQGGARPPGLAANLTVAIVCLAAAAGYVALALALPAGHSQGDAGPAALPLQVGIFGLIVSGLYLVLTLRGRVPAAEAEPGDAPRAAAVAGIFGAALLSVPWLGLAPALGVAGGLVTLLFPGTHRPARAVATAVGLWLIAFLLFGKLLGLPLP